MYHSTASGSTYTFNDDFEGAFTPICNFESKGDICVGVVDSGEITIWCTKRGKIEVKNRIHQAIGKNVRYFRLVSVDQELVLAVVLDSKVLFFKIEQEIEVIGSVKIPEPSICKAYYLTKIPGGCFLLSIDSRLYNISIKGKPAIREVFRHPELCTKQIVQLKKIQSSQI